MKPPSSRAAAGRVPAGPGHRSARPGRRIVGFIPRYRVTWTRVRLGLGLADSGRPRTSSVAIVISATRGR